MRFCALDCYCNLASILHRLLIRYILGLAPTTPFHAAKLRPSRTLLVQSDLATRDWSAFPLLTSRYIVHGKYFPPEPGLALCHGFLVTHKFDGNYLRISFTAPDIHTCCRPQGCTAHGESKPNKHGRGRVDSDDTRWNSELVEASVVRGRRN
jgi:hypothetical protein